MSIDSVYGMEEELGTAFLVFYAIYYLITIGIGIAGYILSSLGLYTIAKRRGIPKPWLSWIPVANVWIVGSISDQFRYVTKAQIRNKRKILLGLAIGMFGVMILMFAGMIVGALVMGDAAAAGVGMMLVLLMAALAMIGVSIAFLIFYYMAMYDLYTSVNPPYNVVFLVLGIIFNVTEPYFIFFNRKKDLGMPPRCDVSAAPASPAPLPPVREPWENNPES